MQYRRQDVYNKKEPFYHFRYSPLIALIMVPFAFIEYPAYGLATWFVILNAAMLAALFFFVRNITADIMVDKATKYMILWGAFFVSLRFYLMNISIGQSDVLAAMLFALFLACYAGNKEILCGLILALVLQFKPAFLPMLFYFLLIGKRALVISAIFGFAALLFAPAAAIGLDKTVVLIRSWADILGMSIPSQLLCYKNQSITYFIGKSLLDIGFIKSSISADRLFFTLGAALTTASFAALILFRRSLKAAEDKKFKYLEVALLIIITLLFSPIMWVAQFVNLMIPAGITILFLSKSRNKKPALIACAGFVAFSIVAGTDLTNFLPAIDRMNFINIAIGTVFLTYALVYSYRRSL